MGSDLPNANARHIKLDIGVYRNYTGRIALKQNDDTVFNIKISDNAVLGAYKAVLAAELPDGSLILQTHFIDAVAFAMPLDKRIVSMPGGLRLELVFLDDEERQISTYIFYAVVEESIHPGDSLNYDQEFQTSDGETVKTADDEILIVKRSGTAAEYISVHKGQEIDKAVTDVIEKIWKGDIPDAIDGKDGATIIMGSVDPEPEEGNINDIFYNTETCDIFQKTAENEWTYKGNNRGKDGRDGLDGKDGENGKDGIDGEDGKDAELPEPWENIATKKYVEDQIENAIGSILAGEF